MCKKITFDSILDNLNEFRNVIHNEHRSGFLPIKQMRRAEGIKRLITTLESEIINLKFDK